MGFPRNELAIVARRILFIGSIFVVTVACAYSTVSYTKADCFKSFEGSMQQSCSANNWQVTQAVESQLLPCLESVDHNTVSLSVMTVANLVPLLEDISMEWTNKTGVPVDIKDGGVQAAELQTNILRQYNRNLTEITAFVFPGLQVGTFEDAGILADISNISESKSVTSSWLDILTCFRRVAVEGSPDFKSKLVVPLDGRIFFMYYRQDILQSFNLSVPNTWDDVLNVASTVNGTDMDNDNVPDWGVCIPLATPLLDCQLWYAVIFSWLAPYTQLDGTSQGALLDPSNFETFFDTAAGREVFGKLRDLSGFTHPSAFSTDTKQACSEYSKAYVAGSCAITFGTTEQFKHIQNEGKEGVVHNTVVRPFPGTSKVLNRTTKELVPCTQQACPYADPLIDEDGSISWVNKAYFVPAYGWLGGVSSGVSTTDQTVAFEFLTYLSSSQEWQAQVLSPNSSVGLGPVRKSVLQIEHWTHRNYTQKQTQQFLDTFDYITSAAENVANDLVIPGLSHNSMLRKVNSAASRVMRGSMTPAEATKMIDGAWMALFHQVDANGVSNKAKWLTMYRDSIMWDPPYSAGPTPDQDELLDNPWSDDSNKNGDVSLFAAVVSPLVVASLALVVLLWCCSKKQQVRTERFIALGAVRPPKAAAGTTLLVTDIQESTKLWEQYDLQLMDEVVKVHHSTIRNLLLEHAGYESMTEGDSFIIAFHSASDAILFAANAQVALLHAAWPPELLEHPLCKPIWMAGVSTDPMHNYTAHTLERPPLSVYSRFSATKLPFNVKEDAMKSRNQYLKPNQTPPKVNVSDELGLLDPMDLGSSSCLSLENSTSFLDLCIGAWSAVDEAKAHTPDPNEPARLAWRGLRVRMGIHSGVAQSSVKANKDDLRFHYTGPELAVAKIVADCGIGGVISLTDSAYQQMSMESLQMYVALLHGGHHILAESMPPTVVYQALPRGLTCRAAFLHPIKTLSALSMGVFDAPTGVAVVVFMKVVGLETLMQWDPEVTEAAVDLLQQEVLALLYQHGGFLLEGKSDLILSVFAQASDALNWATSCLELALMLNWPEKLLNHELCEAVVLNLQKDDGSSQKEVLFRGLRLKVGIDAGNVLNNLHPITGKLSYRGRPMNRAARVAGKAASGQVLCTDHVWHTVEKEDACHFLAAMHVGWAELKGISEKVELFAVKRQPVEHPEWQDNGMIVRNLSAGYSEGCARPSRQQLLSLHTPLGGGFREMRRVSSVSCWIGHMQGDYDCFLANSRLSSTTDHGWNLESTSASEFKVLGAPQHLPSRRWQVASLAEPLCVMIPPIALFPEPATLDPIAVQLDVELDSHQAKAHQ